jgi:hypothetical protein
MEAVLVLQTPSSSSASPALVAAIAAQGAGGNASVFVRVPATPIEAALT